MYCLASLVLAHQAAAACTEPGKSRWGTKTNVPLHSSISHATMVPLTDLMHFMDPVPTVKKFSPAVGRIPPFTNALGLQEGQIVRTKGWLRLVATESNDCEYHIQLTRTTSADSCFIVEIARDDATSIQSTWVRNRAAIVRQWFHDHVTNGAEPTTDSLATPVYVEVVGQLFFDSAHGPHDARGKKGMHATTRWELHPILSIKAATPP
jgi:hypothetical protein